MQGHRLFLLTLLSFSSAPSHASLPLMDFSDLVEKVVGKVVNIQTVSVVTMMPGMDNFLDQFLGGTPFGQEQVRSGLGSGFFIEPSGHIMTNAHVVKGADEVVVVLKDSKKQWPAKIVGIDERTDTAVLRIEMPKPPVPLKFGNSDTMKIGQPVVAIGNPFGLTHSVTAGILSAKNRSIGQGPYDDFLQTDAAINFGNSGGPLFNAQGEVIGMNSAIHASGQGIGYAIPSNQIQTLLPDLLKNGRIIRPWVGFVGENVTPQIRRYLRLKSSNGVIVAYVVENAPAEHAGLRRGDSIVKADEHEIESVNDFNHYLEKKKVGEQVQLDVLRSGQRFRTKLKLAEIPPLEDLPKGYRFL